MKAIFNHCLNRWRRFTPLSQFIIVLIPSLIAANRAGLWLASSVGGGVQQGSSPSLPPIIAVPKTLDFGTVWETNTFHWDLVFQNVSDKPAALRDVHGGCSCTTSQQRDELLLKPGEQVTIPLVIDLFKLWPNDPSEVRAVEVPVEGVLVTGGEKTEHRWVLRGRIRHLLSCQPYQVGLGEDLIAGEGGQLIRVRIRPNRPVSQVRLKRAPEGWSLDLKATGTKGYELDALPCKRKVGAFSDEFQLEVVCEDGVVMPAHPIKVEGRATDDVDVLPCPLDLGVRHLGTTAEGCFWVRARSGGPIQAVELATTDRLLIHIDAHRSGDSWRVDFERLIEAPGHGEYTGTMRVKLQAKGWKEVKYHLKWYGKAAS
jgi:hypothetical protein